MLSNRLGAVVLGLVVLGPATSSGCGGSDEGSFSGGTTSTTTSSGSGGGTAGTGGGTGTGGGGVGGAASGGGGAATGTGGGAGGFDPAQDPTAKINHPGDGEMRQVNVDIPFVGVGTDPQDGNLTGASLVWTSDKEGVIGTGAMFNKALTVLGPQKITLTATDSNNNVGADSITLTIIQ